MRLSRHARGNMRLYGITADEIASAIDKPDSVGREGGKTIAVKAINGRFSGYPLKVVYDTDGPFVITAYPLKKKLWRQP